MQNIKRRFLPELPPITTAWEGPSRSKQTWNCLQDQCLLFQNRLSFFPPHMRPTSGDLQYMRMASSTVPVVRIYGAKISNAYISPPPSLCVGFQQIDWRFHVAVFSFILSVDILIHGSKAKVQNDDNKQQCSRPEPPSEVAGPERPTMLQVQGAKAIQRHCHARSPRSVIFRIQDLPYRARGDNKQQ
jgi:hypothetical protein